MEKHFWLVVWMGILSTLYCSPRTAKEEAAAERMYVTAGYQEEELKTLSEAIVLYQKTVERFPGTQAGKKAQKRYLKLKEVQQQLLKLETIENDSLAGFYEGICKVIPDYLAVLKRLGAVYANDIRLTSRTAAMYHSDILVERVLNIWEKQDRLWAKYSFRPKHEDRIWRDQLCSQAVDVARMLEEFKEYEAAFEVVRRGLEYVAGEDAKSHALVFFSFYTFRMAQNREAINYAEKALSYEFLSTEDKARAHHVIGLSYTYIHQETGNLVDLDAAIKALNISVNLDPGQDHAKSLLKDLRIKRQKLQVSMN